MFKFQRSKFNNSVFIPSLIVIFLIAAFAAIFPNFSNEFFKGMQNYIAAKFGWFYILVVAVILLSVIILGFSKLGEIKLGADHVKPEHKNISWFSMLFAAGMGIGLVFLVWLSRSCTI